MECDRLLQVKLQGTRAAEDSKRHVVSTGDSRPLRDMEGRVLMHGEKRITVRESNKANDTDDIILHR